MLAASTRPAVQGNLPKSIDAAHTEILLALLTKQGYKRHQLGPVALQPAHPSLASSNRRATLASPRESTRRKDWRQERRLNRKSSRITRADQTCAQAAVEAALRPRCSQPRGAEDPPEYCSGATQRSQAASQASSVPLDRLASESWTSMRRVQRCGSASPHASARPDSSDRCSALGSNSAAGSQTNMQTQGTVLHQTSHRGANVVRSFQSGQVLPLLSSFDAGRYQKAVAQLQQRQQAAARDRGAAIVREDMRASRRHRRGDGLAGTYGGLPIASAAADSRHFGTATHPVQSTPHGESGTHAAAPVSPLRTISPVSPPARDAQGCGDFGHAGRSGGAACGVPAAAAPRVQPPANSSAPTRDDIVGDSAGLAGAGQLDESASSADGLNALRALQPQLVATPLLSRANQTVSTVAQPRLVPDAAASFGKTRASQEADAAWGELLSETHTVGQGLATAESAKPQQRTTGCLPRHFDKLPAYLKSSARERGRQDSFQASGLTATEILERVEMREGVEKERLPVLRRSHPARDATRKDDFLRRGSGAVRSSVDSQIGFLASSVAT